MSTPVPGSPSLADNPRLSRWLTVLAEGRVLVRSGKVELGQGIRTALAQIVAEELDVELHRVQVLAAVTGASPDESYTAGSLSIQHSGGALRQVCAQARAALLAAAGETLGVPADLLRVVDGEVLAPDGRRTSYWAHAGGQALEREVGEPVRPKDPASYATVGRPVPRSDLADKVMGRPRFVHDLRLPGQLYGRVVRPPSPGAVLEAVDDTAVRVMAHVVAVVRDGGFLGVVADREEVAIRGAELLAGGCTWLARDTLPDEARLAEYLLAAPATTTVLAPGPAGGPGTTAARGPGTAAARGPGTATAATAGVPAAGDDVPAAGAGVATVGDDAPAAGPGVPAAGAGVARTMRLRFSRPYLAHASLGPSCGVAIWPGDGSLRVWSHSQGVYPLRAELARAFELAPDRVVVEHVEGAGCYGHNGADDAAYDAALLARAVPGRPVQVVWSRADELAWSPFGPAMVVEIEAGVDQAGAVCSWRHEVWGNGHSSRPSSPGHPPLLATTMQDPARVRPPAGDPPMERGGGAGRNAVPLYDFPGVCVVGHRLESMPLRTSALRALGAHLNVFAIEAVVDELALAVGADPIAYRHAMVSDERARAVLAAVAERSGWDRLPPGSGRGVGLARYKGVGAWCAVVAEIEAEDSVRVRRLTVAVDAGLVVNPDGVVNQIEGGAVQAVSWTTKEQVRFDRRQVTSTTWEDYPILTFPEVPPVDVVVIDRPELPSLGVGEASVGPTAAAIGNALRDALGVRFGQLPLTPQNIVAALGA